jgi:FlaA1/EpsC-like NDP-sugar epimerase
MVHYLSDRAKNVVHDHRRLVVVVGQLLLIAASNYAAWLLRYDGDLPSWAVRSVLYTLPVIVIVRAITFVPFRLYQGLWRYTSVHDIQALLGGIGTSSVVSLLIVSAFFGFDAYPRSIFIIDALLLTVLLGSTRMFRRVYLEIARPAGVVRRVLVYGAGGAGAMIVREMKVQPYGYRPIGFVDDDSRKTGERIHGLPVLGTRLELAAIIERQRPDEVLIAIPGADPSVIRGVVKALEPFRLPIKTLPNLRDLLDGTVTVTQIRNLAVEDLLARAPVGLDDTQVRHLVKGRRVLVTGAAGSIGSELCRQIGGFEPESLLMLDRSENGLYAIADELDELVARGTARAIVGDVTDVALVNGLLAAHRPHLIFHAAAHKHVPLMEQHPCEAVKNNITGTRVMVEAAEKHGASRFILISSDKAVNPTSVMGATKRIGEMIIQSASSRGRTEFLAVRFGNVLGSSGSVVPKFLKQIEAGGPVTVTHPDITRYFMLIPEAVQLVLHAASMGGAGTVYVLEMGEPVKVVDMARQLIRGAGYVPDQEIVISFIGLRRGEKMHEELVADREVVEASRVQKVLQIRPADIPDRDLLGFEIAKLERLALRGEVDALIEQLVTIVPSFEPSEEGAAPSLGISMPRVG